MCNKPRASQKTDIGLEIQCSKCQQFWPADEEFFYYNKGAPHSWCRACCSGDPKLKERRLRSASRLSVGCQVPNAQTNHVPFQLTQAMQAWFSAPQASGQALH